MTVDSEAKNVLLFVSGFGKLSFNKGFAMDEVCSNELPFEWFLFNDLAWDFRTIFKVEHFSTLGLNFELDEVDW